MEEMIVIFESRKLNGMVCSVQENAMNSVPHYEFEVQVQRNLADADAWDTRIEISVERFS
jgi:hypothetical protein